MTNQDKKSSSNSTPTVLITTSVGTGIRYFFQTGIVPALLKSGIKVVGLVPNSEDIKKDMDGMPSSFILETIEIRNKHDQSGWILSRILIIIEVTVQYLRTSGVSNKVNRAVFRDIQRHQNLMIRQGKTWFLIHPLRLIALLLRNSKMARGIYRWFVNCRPIESLETDIFEKHHPSLIVTNGPGWNPIEEIIIREARAQGIPSVATLIGWDHTASQGLPLAMPDRIRTWSEIQKRELVEGCDVLPESVDVGGVASFDSYNEISQSISKDDYLVSLGLDKTRKLICFGCTFVGISSNVEIVRSLARSVEEDRLAYPSQLIIRLHPSHYKKPRTSSYDSDMRTAQEIDVYKQLARDNPHVHIDSPAFSTHDIPMATNRTDIFSLASLLRHTDVFVTLFSTMVLEAAVNDTPVVSVAIDPPMSDREGRLMSITDAMDWPTHERIISSKASTVAMTYDEMIKSISKYLENPDLHSVERKNFAVQECTYVDNSSSNRIAAYLKNMTNLTNI